MAESRTSAGRRDAWNFAWIAALGPHLAEELTGLLPDDEELVASGTELSTTDGAAVALAFRPRSGDESDCILLRPVVPPRPLEAASTAG